ncbi:MAG: putative Zn-dependent protease [Cocleimonas sp.]|jgi:predicted Zn-dependent protease
MEYQNPKLPENNVSKEHPIKEFSTLLIGTLVLVVVISIALSVAGSSLAGLIPYSAEKKVAGLYDISSHSDNDRFPKIASYLQQLADKISIAQSLPPEMKITVHYMDSPTMNAFATLGGNVFMFRGLLEKLPNENSLVTLLGHEVAHVKYRHPIKSFGGGIAVAIAMTTIGSSADTNILGDAGLLSTLQFSRKMESQSDLEAMHNLNTIYGHLNGGAELFRIFKKARGTEDDSSTKSPSEFFSTHPQDEKRINSFKETAKEKGWSETGQLTLLPDYFNF